MIYYIVFLVIAFFVLYDVYELPSQRFVDSQAYITASMLVLLAGLRWNCWSDWDNYYYCFIDNGESEIDLEIGYLLWNKFVFLFSHNYTVYLLISYSILLGSFLYLSRKYSNCFYVSTFLLIYVVYLLPSGGFRQFIALFFFLLSLSYAIENKIAKSFCLLLIGSMVHRSLLLCLPVLYIVKKDFVQKHFWLLLIIALGISQLGLFMLLIEKILSTLVDDIFASYTSRMLLYTKDGIEDNLINFTLLRHLAFAVFFIYVYKTGTEYKEDTGLIIFKKFLNIYLLGVLLSIVLIGQFDRLAAYFISSECILFPMSYQYIKFPGKRIILTLSLVLFMLVLLTYKLNTFYPELFIPYRSIFDNSI